MFGKGALGKVNDSVKTVTNFGNSLAENIRTGEGKIGKSTESMLNLLTDQQTISHASE